MEYELNKKNYVDCEWYNEDKHIACRGRYYSCCPVCPKAKTWYSVGGREELEKLSSDELKAILASMEVRRA